MSLPIKSGYNALVRASRSVLPKYFRKDEVDRILEICEKKGEENMALLVDFLWKTGVRVSELIRVRFSDIDPKAKTLRVVTLKKSRRKGPGRKPAYQAERVIPIPDDLLHRIAFRRIETQAKENDLIFSFSRTTAYNKVKAACALTGITDERAHPHTF